MIRNRIFATEMFGSVSSLSSRPMTTVLEILPSNRIEPHGEHNFHSWYSIATGMFNGYMYTCFSKLSLPRGPALSGRYSHDKRGTPHARAIGGSAFSRKGRSEPTRTSAMTEIDTLMFALFAMTSCKRNYLNVSMPPDFLGFPSHSLHSL